MADAIVQDAKEQGANKLLGSVVPSAKGSTESLKVLIAYGMALESKLAGLHNFQKGALMGAVGGLIGINGGNSGTGFSTPSGTNAAQLQTAYTGNQNALTSQQNLLNALQQQNGLGNQTNVYNQLQGVASGQGPNPAQAMLNQETGQNVANQAALMAGQRGASQNVGLMARQAAQQGANLQQQAVGQGASMQAQQGLNALLLPLATSWPILKLVNKFKEQRPILKLNKVNNPFFKGQILPITISWDNLQIRGMQGQQGHYWRGNECRWSHHRSFRRWWNGCSSNDNKSSSNSRTSK